MAGGITIEDFYSYYTGQIASEKKQVDVFVTTKTMSVENYEAKLEEIRGVSEVEETTNMVLFQRVLEANTRFINVVDEMLNTIVNNLGYVGR
jgi:flagellar hook-associated protein 1 FlgK